MWKEVWVLIMEFRYKGINEKGKIVKGFRTGNSQWAVIEELKKQGISCIQCDAFNSNKKKYIKKKASHKDMVLICRTMKNNLKSGIPLTSSLKLAASHMKNRSLASAIDKIQSEIQCGDTLTDALKKNKDTFPEFFISMVQIGEKSGNLEEIFGRLEIYYGQEYKRRRKIISITMYPAFVFILSITVALVIIVKFLPKFFMNMNINIKEMPLITRIYMKIAEIFKSAGLMMFPIVILGMLLINMAYTKFKESENYEKFRYKSIFTGRVCKGSFYCRFTMAMHMIITSGLDIKGAFYILKDIEPSQFLREKYIRAIEDLEAGNVLSDIINGFNMFPKEFVASIVFGEESGTLDESILTYNEIFEDDLKESIDRIIKLMEPSLILMAGLFVLSIYIAIMVPLYSIYTL